MTWLAIADAAVMFGCLISALRLVHRGRDIRDLRDTEQRLLPFYEEIRRDH